ncbi:14245_t:CDS:10 [Funneliformis geosporum]|uniref:14245_t:CDS:1 n=1 Tax=Funneliformis geosporum TaxID=1117311 RepID=A0A9W4SFP0_9GLOM|nr:14245_t:CDS:10 [Funneliformis geosporum]
MSWNPPGAPSQYNQPRPNIYGISQPPQRPGYQATPYASRPAQNQPFVPGQTPPPFAPPSMSMWTEHTSPDGRKYYFNTISKQSSWDKPEELKTAEERALGSCSWKEFTAEGGRKYYYNSITKESKWEIPAEYKDFLDKLEIEKNQSLHIETSNQSNGSIVSPNQQDMERARQLSVPSVSPVNVTPVNVPIKSMGVAAPVVGSNIPMSIQQPEPQKVEFDTKEEAEAAFRELLKESGVKADWTWEQTMRAIIANPMYRALKTLAERKQAFHDYSDDLRKKEEEEKRAKAIKIRQDFVSLLESHPEINSSTRYRKVCDILSEEPALKAIEDERLREEIFSEYVYDLRKQEKEIQRAIRKENMEKFNQLLRSLPNITEATRWADAQQIYMNTPEYQQDKTLREMDMLDFLAVYEEHIKSLERETAEKKKRDLEEQTRQQRRNRDAYRALMDELREKHVISAKSKWKETYPLIHTDGRYQNMLGQPGSNPLELFWDVVEELDELLYQQRKIVVEIMKAKEITINTGMTFELFQAACCSDERVSSVDENNLKIIFEQLQRKQERRQRRKLDAFKAILRHFEAMISPDTTWEQVRPILEKTEEFQAIESEEQRLEVFNKFIDRVREKILKKGDDSEEEEGTLRDDDIEEDRHVTSDRKKKHKSSHRSSHHRRSHHYSDYSAESGDCSDKEKESGDKRKRRKKTKTEARYAESRYQEYNRYNEQKHSDYISRSSRSPRAHDYKNHSPKQETFYKNMSPKPEVLLKSQSPKNDETQIEVIKHDDSSAEEGDKFMKDEALALD